MVEEDGFKSPPRKTTIDRLEPKKALSYIGKMSKYKIRELLNIKSTSTKTLRD